MLKKNEENLTGNWSKDDPYLVVAGSLATITRSNVKIKVN